MKSWPIFSSTVIAAMVLRTHATAVASRLNGFAVRSTMSAPCGSGDCDNLHRGVLDALPTVQSLNADIPHRIRVVAASSHAATIAPPCKAGERTLRAYPSATELSPQGLRR